MIEAAITWFLASHINYSDQLFFLLASALQLLSNDTGRLPLLFQSFHQSPENSEAKRGLIFLDRNLMSYGFFWRRQRVHKKELAFLDSDSAKQQNNRNRDSGTEQRRPRLSNPDRTEEYEGRYCPIHCIMVACRWNDALGALQHCCIAQIANPASAAFSCAPRPSQSDSFLLPIVIYLVVLCGAPPSAAISMIRIIFRVDQKCNTDTESMKTLIGVDALTCTSPASPSAIWSSMHARGQRKNVAS